MPTKKRSLTDSEKEQLKACLDELDALAETEPPRMEDILTPEEYNRVSDYILLGKGDPPDYIDRFTVSEITDPDGTKHKSFYDTAWTEWVAKEIELSDKYHDVIAKAIFVWTEENKTTPGAGQLVDVDKENNLVSFNIEQIIRFLVMPTVEKPKVPADDLLLNDFFPMLNNNSVNDFSAVSLKNYNKDKLAGNATFTTRHGTKYTIENYKNIYGALSTSTQKIMYTAISYLTRDNFRKGGLDKATVRIPLISYAEANRKKVIPRKMDTPEEQEEENKTAQDNMDNFVKELRHNLHDLKHVNVSWERRKGKRLKNVGEQQIISGYSVNPDAEMPNIEITFDALAAQSLMESGIMQFPKVLLSHDNRNSNGFSVGYAIAVHNSNFKNISIGTADTLRVETLIADAPDIAKNPEELKAKGQRNWKRLIKGRLEKALDSNIKIGYLKKWQYRDARTNETYTPDQAKNLSWGEYNSLRIDYTVAQNNPKLEEYVQKKQAEIEQKKQEKEEKEKTAE